MISVSQIGRWAECEAYALAHPARAPARVHVAQLVGTMAHAQLADDYEHPRPPTVVYDSTTRSWGQVIAQVNTIEDAARAELDKRGWRIIDQEDFVFDDTFTGHLDLRCYHRKNGEAIVDLKTGAVGAGWLQVGGYLTGAYHGEEIPWGGILHVPRLPVFRVPTATLTMRPAAALRESWRVLHDRVSAVLDGAPASRTPGLHCQRCPLRDCAVRP